MAKFGERFVDDMIDRGRRELGGVMFPDSNIAQPMYPLRGGYEVSKGGMEKTEPTLAERLEEVPPDLSGPEHDDRDRGFDRE
jgi:hypothetical protein